MLRVDTRDLERLHRDLHKARTRALPYAVRDALNQQAFAGRKLWQERMKREFVTGQSTTVALAGWGSAIVHQQMADSV